jgi:hypothetical protein
LALETLSSHLLPEHVSGTTVIFFVSSDMLQVCFKHLLTLLNLIFSMPEHWAGQTQAERGKQVVAQPKPQLSSHEPVERRC